LKRQRLILVVACALAAIALGVGLILWLVPSAVFVLALFGALMLISVGAYVLAVGLRLAFEKT
jgi:hypothetical protein